MGPPAVSHLEGVVGARLRVEVAGRVCRGDARTEMFVVVGLVLGVLGQPRAVDHHHDHDAQVDARRVTVDRRQHAHQRQHQPTRRELCAPAQPPAASARSGPCAVA